MKIKRTKLRKYYCPLSKTVKRKLNAVAIVVGKATLINYTMCVVHFPSFVPKSPKQPGSKSERASNK